MAENIDAELKSTLQRQVPLLRVTPSDSLRRDIASMILDATSSFFKRWNQQVDSLEHPYTAEEALHVLLLSLGRGDAQVRHRVLEMLAVTSQEKCRRILWEFLPFTFPEEPSQTASSEIVKALQSILAKEQATVLPILKALSLLPVEDDSPNETFQIAMDAIPVAEQNQLSALFQIMLVNVASDEDSSSAYQAIRNKICHVETLGDVPSLVSVSGQAVVALRNAFLNESSGGLLAKAFVKRVIQLVQSNPGRCLFFDWAVILTLLEQPSHKKKFEDLFDEWLTGSSFPFAAINRLVSIFCLVSKSDPPVLYTALIRSFMHLSLFLMVAPLRISVPRRTRQTYESVVFDFLLALDDTSQAELLQSIVHLSAELAQGPVELSLRRRRSLSDESVDYACRSVNHILGKLAERSPSILGCFRHVLESRLSGSLFSQSEPSDLKSVSEISNMLSSLAVSGPHSQAIARVPDLMVLLKKLLFPSAETCVDALDDFTIVAKGLILATAMIKKVNLDEDARDTIKKWVLRVILPSTRRMIEPELGSPGLKFLEAWMNEEVNNDTHLVFQHFRKVLSNTGLIQVLSHYQKSKRKYHTVLGYEKTTGLGSSTLPEKENERRHIVFCVTFFLKHFELRNSDRWKHAMAWTFELVDTYLRIGRGKARTNWKPDCWLQAMIEFPKVKLAGHGGSHRSIRIKQWLRKIFEDLNPENFKATEIVVDPNDLLEYLQEVQAIGDIQLFCDEVLFFELSLLVGLAVVAAVLKNSLAHFRWTAPTASTHTRLLTFLQNNFIRLYGMKIKLRFLFVLLKALRSKRLTQMDDYARTRAAEAERTGQNAEHSLFRTSQYLNQVDLWECLTDCRHDIVLKTGIGALKFNTKTESLGDHSFLDVVHLRTCILSHICDQCNGSTLSLLSGSGRECDAKLEKMASTAFLLIDDFPSLRKALWQQDDEQYLLQLKALAVLYLRLFHLVAERHCVDQKPIECSLKFLDRAFHGEDAGHKSQKVLVEQVNQALYKRLADAIDVDIGNNIVELLSLFVARIKGRFVGEVIQANLSFMYTVYDDMDNDAVSVEIGRPRVFQSLLKASITDFTTDRHKALIRAVDTMVSKVSEASDRRDSQVVLRHFQSGLVRHFGLVHFTDSPSKEYVLSASKLITEIDSFLFIFGRKVGLKRDQTHLGDPKSSKRAWASGLPFIPALDAKTFHEMYHSVMRFVIGAAALSDPSSTPSSGVPALGPYVDLAALFQLFGRLIAIYKMNLSVFPRKSFTFVIQDARMMLTVAVVQLNCSVDWRNLQPLLSVVDRRRGQVDLGAMSYFETFLNVVSYNTVGQLWRLAEKMRSDTSNDMSKIAALRAVTDKASRKLKTIANAHNLKAISFESMDEFDGQEKPPLSDPIRGFHLLAAADKAWWNEMSCLPIVGTPRGDASAAKKRSLQDLGSSSDDKNVTEEDLPDQGGDTQSLDSDSFRVAGGWGGDSDGDEDDSVDELLLLVPKLTQHN